jgi:hypothetical protein
MPSCYANKLSRHRQHFTPHPPEEMTNMECIIRRRLYAEYGTKSSDRSLVFKMDKNTETRTGHGNDDFRSDCGLSTTYVALHASAAAW